MSRAAGPGLGPASAQADPLHLGPSKPDSSGPRGSRPAEGSAHASISTHANLIWELALAAFRIKYSESLLGYVWSLIKPLMIFGMMYVVFALFLLNGRPGVDATFPSQLLVGIVLWTYFAEATSSGLQSVVANAELVGKAYFPRWILVIAGVTSALFTLVLNFILVLGLGLGFRWFEVSALVLTVPALLLELTLFTVGLALLLAPAFVYYRDLGHIWEVVLQLLFFASGIVYPITLLPAQFRRLLLANPLAQIVEDVRHALVPSSARSSEEYLRGFEFIPLVVAVGLTVLGAVVFRRLARKMSDHL